MQGKLHFSALILGFLLCTGLVALGAILGFSALKHKEFERSVVVKGLSERDYPADIVIWPIPFTVADNDIGQLYEVLETRTEAIRDFLLQAGIDAGEISWSSPEVNDLYLNQYRGDETPRFRYNAQRTVTVYSTNVELVRETMRELDALGREGLVLTGNNWRAATQYLFTRLNEVKPEMVEEATRNAREVAGKFAQDSQSRLGRIKQASQGQFSIRDRDANNPHIKTVRVVSTVRYYLAD